MSRNVTKRDETGRDDGMKREIVNYWAFNAGRDGMGEVMRWRIPPSVPSSMPVFLPVKRSAKSLSHCRPPLCDTPILDGGFCSVSPHLWPSQPPRLEHRNSPQIPVYRMGREVPFHVQGGMKRDETGHPGLFRTFRVVPFGDIGTITGHSGTVNPNPRVRASHQSSVVSGVVVGSGQAMSSAPQATPPRQAGWDRRLMPSGGWSGRPGSECRPTPCGTSAGLPGGGGSGRGSWGDIQTETLHHLLVGIAKFRAFAIDPHGCHQGVSLELSLRHDGGATSGGFGDGEDSTRCDSAGNDGIEFGEVGHRGNPSIRLGQSPRRGSVMPQYADIRKRKMHSHRFIFKGAKSMRNPSPAPPRWPAIWAASMALGTAMGGFDVGINLHSNGSATWAVIYAVCAVICGVETVLLVVARP